MLRILHLADLHLGWEPSYLTDEKRSIRHRERNLLLRKAVDYALSPGNDIHAVLIAGDLFEQYRPEEPLVRNATDQLSRLTRAGLLVVTIPGNHDEITYRESVYRQYGDIWPGELVRNPMPELSVSTEVNGTGVHVYSLAYTGGLTRPSAIDFFPREDLPGLHIGAFHGSLDWEGLADRSLPLKTSQLAGAGYHFIALGHYHRYSEHTVGTGTAVYPGAVEFKSFNDPGTGYVTIVEWSGNSIKTRKSDIDVRKCQKRNLDLSAFENMDDLRSACRGFADPEIMLELSLTGTPGFAFNAGKLADELEPDFFYLKIDNASQFFAETFLDSVAREPTVRGAYVRRLREKQGEAQTGREKKVLEQALLRGLAALQGSESNHR